MTETDRASRGASAESRSAGGASSGTDARRSSPSDGPSAVGGATLADFVELIRPAHWIKNIVVFAGPAASLRLADSAYAVRAILAFVCFCLAASSVYAINDVMDREGDAKHPTKRTRPVARGAIRPATALGVGLLLALGSALLSLVLPPGVTLVLLVYLGLTASYSFGLRRRVILDVIVIATGFVLRAWAGSLSVEVPTSEWLIACVFTLCLFMGFGKRRCEVAMIANAGEAREHRKTLLRYTPDLLNHLITVSAGIAIITFLLYTLDKAGHASPFRKDHLFYTLPIVVYGVFRFAMLTEVGRYTGPTEIVLKDRAMLVTLLVWTLCALVIAYQTQLFGVDGLPGLFDIGAEPQ